MGWIQARMEPVAPFGKPHPRGSKFDLGAELDHAVGGQSFNCTPWLRSSCRASGTSGSFLKPKCSTTRQQSWPSGSASARLSKPIQGTLWWRTETKVCLVQHLVVLEVARQCVGRLAGLRTEQDRRAGYARWRAEKERIQKRLEFDCFFAQPLREQLASALPGGHQREHDAADGQRESAAVDHLDPRWQRKTARPRPGRPRWPPRTAATDSATPSG